jgi:drug/metabolite transporter (DMT)-like permease
MAKMLLILFIGLTFESTGVVLLKKGMTQVGEIRLTSAGEIVRAVKAGVTNSQVLLGVFFEALFFACLLILMSKSDISFLWPLTALSFVFATLAAMVFLHEQVSAVRWAGVVLIMLGAAFISYSEQVKQRPAGEAIPHEADHAAASGGQTVPPGL